MDEGVMKKLEEFQSYKKELFMGILQEECAEVIVAVSKIDRFGLYSYNPADGTYNKENLIQEIGDVLGMIELLQSVPELGLTAEALQEAKEKKINKVMYWVNNPVRKLD